jgi:hypothetical protein
MVVRGEGVKAHLRLLCAGGSWSVRGATACPRSDRELLPTCLDMGQTCWQGVVSIPWVWMGCVGAGRDTRCPHNPKVAGSNPAPATTHKPPRSNDLGGFVLGSRACAAVLIQRLSNDWRRGPHGGRSPPEGASVGYSLRGSSVIHRARPVVASNDRIVRRSTSPVRRSVAATTIASLASTAASIELSIGPGRLQRSAPYGAIRVRVDTRRCPARC